MDSGLLPRVIISKPFQVVPLLSQHMSAEADLRGVGMLQRWLGMVCSTGCPQGPWEIRAAQLFLRC